MKNPEIPGRIQIERFIPVVIFRKKSDIFRVITFFPFLPKLPKFLYHTPYSQMADTQEKTGA